MTEICHRLSAPVPDVEVRLQAAQSAWNSIRDGLPDTPPPEELDDVKFWASKGQTFQPIAPLDEPVVAIIGVGYVGVHLVTTFASQYKVIAFDISEKRLKAVARELNQYPSITFTTDATQLASATHYCVSVPTLLLSDKRIDTSFLREAISNIALYARPGATVVIESSVAVGMTRQLLAQLMISRGLYGGMSPERVDPGRTEPPIESIPKIISGLDDIVPGSLNSIKTLYSKVFKRVVTVSKPEVAEMMKLYENCQRMMCIAYANEMADACVGHGIDPFEVCSAAATKPFGYMPYTPSLGVGGHCIPVNPYYLLSNSNFPLLQSATEKMSQRPASVGDRAMKSLLQESPEKFTKRQPRVLVVGVGFKRGQSVLSNSPGISLIRNLLDTWDAYVSFADPLVEESAIPYVPKLHEPTEWNREALECFDLILVSFKQEGLDFEVMRELRDVKVEMWCP